MGIWSPRTYPSQVQEALVDDGGKLQSLRKLREIEEQVHQQLYAILWSVEELSLEDGRRRGIFKSWLNYAQEIVAPLTND